MTCADHLAIPVKSTVPKVLASISSRDVGYTQMEYWTLGLVRIIGKK